MIGRSLVLSRWMSVVTLAALAIGMSAPAASAAPAGGAAHVTSTPADDPPTDSDGDGVADPDDNCPSVPGVVENYGCPNDPIDSDGDGVYDDTDQCPSDPGSATYNGCPVPDGDGDGISDEVDACPTLPGPNDGCPLPDFDGDGVYDDGTDRCPNEAGPAGNNGCPYPDSDSDGVTDDVDQCPNDYGPMENGGCPNPGPGDTDNDGVDDDVDQCATVAGPSSNAGCPLTAVRPATVKFYDRCGTRNDRMIVPTKRGVSYVSRTKLLAGGSYVRHGSVTVRARAKNGYRLTGTTRWSTTFSERSCRRPRG